LYPNKETVRSTVPEPAIGSRIVEPVGNPSKALNAISGAILAAKGCIGCNLLFLPLLKNKKEIQNILFPEGIVYNSKKREYLTKRMNEYFELAALFSRDYEENKKGNIGYFSDNSLTVAETFKISNQVINDFKRIVELTYPG